MKRIVGILLALSISICTLYASNSDKKTKRLIAKADKAFESFVYTKAVDYYIKAIDGSNTNNEEVCLKIADSYRLMNKPVSAENWYAKIEDSEILSDQDLMNYAKILLRNGKDQKAKEVSKHIKVLDLSKFERFTTIENVEIYYADSLAYFVENLNINTPQSEFSPTFVDDGFVFVSNRERKGVSQASYGWDDSYFLDLYYSELKDGQISEPAAMSKRINTIFHEGPATFFDNGSKLIFTRNNFNLGRERTSVEGINKLKLYYAEKSAAGKWSKAEPLPFNSDEYSVGHPSFHEATQTLYFASDMPGGYGKSDIYKVQLENGNWGEPVNLGDKINSLEDDLFPYVSTDQILYFASEGHPGIGGLDVYKVLLSDENNSVENLGFPINTPNDDFGLIVEDKSGFLASNRDGGSGNDDIYKVDIYSYDMDAKLIDAVTGEDINGSLTAVDSRNKSQLDVDAEFGKVAFNIARGRKIIFTGEKEGYEPANLTFNTLDIPLEADNYTVAVPIRKLNLKADVFRVSNPGEVALFSKDEILRGFTGSIEDLKNDLKSKYYEIGNIYEIESIYYDFDKSNIRQDAVVSLDQLIDVLNSNDFNVILGAHTDSRGSNAYNDRLAKSRVNSVYNYLIEKGISKDRISFDSFGERNLVNECGDSANCDDNQHQLNRRTEIRLKIKE